MVTRSTKRPARKSAPHARSAPRFDPLKTRYSLQEYRHLIRGALKAAARERSSESFLEFMKFVKEFHDYSFCNRVLIDWQRPGAHYVMSRTKWLRKFNRSIRRGAKPIRIMVPIGYGRSFEAKPVYDIAQTTGGKIPEYLDQFLKPATEKFDNRWYDRVLAYARELEIPIKFKDLGISEAGNARTTNFTETWQGMPRWTGGGGVLLSTKANNFLVTLNTRAPRSVRFQTLAHEIAHIQLGHLGGNKKRQIPDRSQLPASAMELEAEGVAYLVCKDIGHDTFSKRYFALQNLDHAREMRVESIITVATKLASVARGGYRKPKAMESVTVPGSHGDAEPPPDPQPIDGPMSDSGFEDTPLDEVPF